MKNPKLPDMAFVVHNITQQVVMVKNGESGYYDVRYETKTKAEAEQLVMELNADLGITSKAITKAMLVGSMFGWNIPGADPDKYDDEGKPVNRSSNPRQGKNK